MFTFSLNNYIEIVKIESLFAAGVNQFEMIAASETTRIRDTVGRYKIFNRTHQAYEVAEFLPDRIRVREVSFTDPLLPGRSYLFVNRKNTMERERLERRLYEMYNMRAGASVQGREHKRKQLIRFPFQMPSRGKIFR